MRLIHTAPRANADRILASGFEDCSEQRERQPHYKGAWLSDCPLGRMGGVSLELHLPDELTARYELPSKLHGYRRWLIPAAILKNVSVREVDWATARHP